MLRVQKIYLFGDLDDADVKSIKVGMDDYLLGPGSTPAKLFAFGAEGSAVLRERVCNVGQQLQIRFVLKASMPVRMRVVILGITIEDEPVRYVGVNNLGNDPVANNPIPDPLFPSQGSYEPHR